MSARHPGHYGTWNKDNPKRGEKKKCGEALYSTCVTGSALYPTNVAKFRYLNSDICKWVIIICNLSTKLKEKQWSTPGGYTICGSHSRKNIFSNHHNTYLSKF